MLEFDVIQYVDRRQIALALLAKEKHEIDLVQDQDFRQILCRYSSRVADEEMTALVAEPFLRLPVQKVNPDSLDTFDPKVIARYQSRCKRPAPQVSYILEALIPYTVALLD